MNNPNQQQYFENYHQTQSRYQSSKQPSQGSPITRPFQINSGFTFQDEQPSSRYNKPYPISQGKVIQSRAKSNNLREEAKTQQWYQDPQIEVYRARRDENFQAPKNYQQTPYTPQNIKYQQEILRQVKNRTQNTYNNQSPPIKNIYQQHPPQYQRPQEMFASDYGYDRGQYDNYQQEQMRQYIPQFQDEILYNQDPYMGPQMMAPKYDNNENYPGLKMINPNTRFDDHQKNDQVLRKEHPFRREFQEDVIGEALKDLALYEAQIERLRVALSAQPEFRINQLYQEFDENGSGRLYGVELKRALKDFDVIASEQDIMLVILQYSVASDHLNPNEFMATIHPLTHVQTNCGQIDQYQYNMSTETKHLIGKIFKMLLNTEIAAEYYRHEIKQKNIELQQVFEFINESKSGTISFDELKHFIYTKGFYIDPVTMQGIYRRFDKNNSGRVTFQEFSKQFQPKL